MTRILELLVGPEGEGSRLDAFLAVQEGMPSRSACARLVEAGAVTINGTDATSKSERVVLGDRIRASIEEPEPAAPGALVPNHAIPLDIRYEDDRLIVLSKQAGLVCHPSPGHVDDTLANALVAHCGYDHLGTLQGDDRPGIVHRLDKDTSGVMMAAKNDRAHVDLAEQIREKTAQRIYRAIVCGTIAEDRGEIRAPIGRHPTERKKMAVVPGGKEATTLFRVVERFPAHTLVECRLKTGRTHQIRVHMAYIGHPLLGDPKYGRKTPDIAGQALHSCELSFTHPRTKERMTFAAEMPEDMKAILHALRRGR